MSGKAEAVPGPAAPNTCEKPAIIHSEKVLARCVTCASADPNACGPNGPLLGS